MPRHHIDLDRLAQAMRRIESAPLRVGQWSHALPEHQEYWRQRVRPLVREYDRIAAPTEEERQHE